MSRHLLNRRAALVGFILVGLILVSSTLTQSSPSGGVHVLIVTGGHDFDEDGFFAMFRQMEGISFTQATYLQGAEEKLSREGERDFDAIVFYDMHQEKEPQWKGIKQLLAQGKGMVFLHHSLWSYDGTWPEYCRLVGGRASSKEKVVPGASPTSTYKHDEHSRVHIADAASPITSGLHDFDIVDETYNHYWIDPKVHILLTTDDATSEHVIAWSHKYKRSRVVYIELGHGPSAYQNGDYRTLVQQAIFSVTRK